MMEFFIRMNDVPRTTHQMIRVMMKAGKPTFYEGTKLKATRLQYEYLLKRHAPKVPYEGAVSLHVRWQFSNRNNRHKTGDWKTTRPDTDNLNKLLKDVMTKCEFWHDDAQVVHETIEKVWHERAGIYIKVESLE